MNNEKEYDEFEDLKKQKKFIKAESESDEAYDEKEQEIEDYEQEMRDFEREMRHREHEMEDYEREIEREQRRADKRGMNHKEFLSHPIPPIPPIPPVPPVPPIPSMRHFQHSYDYSELKAEEEFYRNRRRKNITIRGLKSSLYEDFSTKIQSHNMNLGIAISKLMNSAISKFNGEFPVLSANDIKPPKRLLRLDIYNMDSITIEKNDLLEAQAKITLSDIKFVKIESDVSDEIFRKYIHSINHCTKVLIPKSIPKLISLSMLNKCPDYEFY